jgi:hypothetical protein
MARVEAEVRSPEVDEMLAFIRSSKRGVARGVRAGGGEAEDE